MSRLVVDAKRRSRRIRASGEKWKSDRHVGCECKLYEDQAKAYLQDARAVPHS